MGKMMFKVEVRISLPNKLKASVNASIKKLQYLKKNKIPTLSTMVPTNIPLLLLFPCTSSPRINKPDKNVVNAVSNNKPTKRQSHQA